MCKACKWHQRNMEEDGSFWSTCTVDQEGGYGHNLYDGHFYGGPIRGRFCPYFTTPDYQGRDPVKDIEAGTFHVPYNHEYDGD